MRSIALVIALVTALIAPAFACGLVPWQLCGYGRSDWSTKLIRGLTTEAPAGFRSRRGPSHDSTLVTPHNAPFSTYKAPRVHHAVRRRGLACPLAARAQRRDQWSHGSVNPRFLAGQRHSRGDPVAHRI